VRRIRCRSTFATVVSLVALFVAGCGGGDESGYTENDIASALGFHPGHGERAHETLYERAPGKDCVVLQVLTSSDEVEAAQREAANLPTALAVNSNGDAGVIFSGFGTFSQDECVAPAESDLNSLSK
jgi:L-asparaginase II